MSDIHNPASNGQADPESFELLRELEQNTPDSVKKMRSHTRLSIRVKVVVQPGNASDRLTLKVQGVTGDLSAGGCQMLLPVPLGVGDVYWLAFDQATLPVPPLMARCMRCRLIREDAFECGFAFFKPVDIPRSMGARDGDRPLV